MKSYNAALFFIAAISTPLCAQTSASEIRMLMDAVEERNEAAEDANAAAFKLQNEYHQKVMASPHVVMYSLPNSMLRSPNVAFRDSLLDNFKEPVFEFDLGPDDYEVPRPQDNYFYFSQGEPDDAVPAVTRRNAAIATATAALTAKQAETYTAPNPPFDESGSSPVYDRIGFLKARAEAWVAARKAALEEGEDIWDDNFWTTWSPLTNPGPNPDNALRNQKFLAESEQSWQKNHDRAVARLERWVHVVSGPVIGFTDNSELDAYTLGDGAVGVHTEQYEQWLANRAAWHEEMRDAAATTFLDEANGYAEKVEAVLNGSDWKNAVAKFSYLEHMPYSSPCGAAYQKAIIAWTHENPNEFDQELVTLNEMSKHLDRISTAYIRLGKLGATNEIDIRSYKYSSTENFPPLGLVNYNNFRSKISAMQNRIRHLDTLRWPMSLREYSAGMSVPANSISEEQMQRDLGEASSNAYAASGWYSFSYRNPSYPGIASFTPPRISSEARWSKGIIQRLQYSENPSDFEGYGFGTMYDMACTKAGRQGELYLLTQTSNPGLRAPQQSDLPLDNLARIREWNETPIDLDGNIVNFVSKIESDGSIYEDEDELPSSENKRKRALHVLDHLIHKEERKYAVNLADLGLPGSITISCNQVQLDDDDYKVEAIGSLKPHLPTGQIDNSDRYFGGIQGHTTLLFKPAFNHVPEEPFTLEALEMPEAEFTTMLSDNKSGFRFPLPMAAQSSEMPPYFELPVMYNFSSEGVAYASTGAKGLWGFIDVEGDTSDLLIKTEDSKVVTSYLWRPDEGQFGTSTLYGWPEISGRGRAIKEISCKSGKVEFEWIGHYHFKLKYYYNGNPNPVRTYEVSVGGVASPGQLIEETYSTGAEDVRYPSGFETITVKKDGKLWVKATVVNELTASTSVDTESVQLYLYDDEGQLEETKYFSYGEDNPFTEGEFFIVRTEHASGDIREESISRTSNYGPYRWNGELLPGSLEDWAINYENFPRGYYGMYKLIGPGNISIGDNYGLNSLAPQYTEEFISLSSSADWTHLPLIRLPKQSTLHGTDWTRDGEGYEYEHDGTLKEHRFKTGGMNAVRTIMKNGNSFDDKTTVSGSEISSATISYPSGLSKVVSDSGGVSSSVEYFTDEANGGLPWFPKKISTEAGETTFVYSKPPGGGLETVATFDPAGDDPEVTTVTLLDQNGELLSETVASDGTTVSSVVATGHSETPLGKPTQIVVTSGGVTKTRDLEYHPDGSLKKTDDGDGDISEYEWDVLGRIADGTKIGGLTVLPKYDGFKNEINIGGDVIKSEADVYGRTLDYEDPRGAGLKVTKTSDTTHDINITSEDNRGFQQSRLPDGTPGDSSGGLGSPGSSVGYGVEAVNGVNCIKVTTTVVSGSTDTDVVATDYYDGNGRIVRHQEPHPMGTGVVNTDYAYDMSARKVTVTPPSPAKPIIVQFDAGWKNPVVTQGGRSISITSTVSGGTVNAVVRNAGREIYSKSTSLATGESTTKVKRRNAVTTTPSSDGNTITVTGPRNLNVDLNFNRFGFSGMDGTVAGKSFDSNVARNNKGIVENVTVDPPGPAGSVNYGFAPSGRMTGAVGPGINLGLGYDFTGGGVKVTGTDNATGKGFLASSDSEGNPRRSEATGRDSLQFDGSASEGDVTMTATGFANQPVELDIGPTGLPLSKTRADGSGTSFAWNADSSLDSYTRFDGAANGGGSNTFVMNTHPDTGFPIGYTSANSSLVTVPNNDGTTAAVTFNSKDMDGQTQTYSAQYPSYFDDAPLIETFGGSLAGYQVVRDYNPNTGEISRVELWKNSAMVHAVDYTPDGRSQIGTVTSSVGKSFSATYSYPDDFTETLTTGAVAATKSFLGDGTGRLSSSSTSTGGGVYSAVFGHNGFNRNKVTLSAPGEAAVVWDYVFQNTAATGQLQSASTSAGASYTYNHDAAGNRAGTTPNNANQYSISRVAGSRNYTVSGKVAPGSTVTISRAGGAAEPVAVAPNGIFSKSYAAPPGGEDPASIPLVIEGTLPGAGDNGTNAVAAKEQTVTLAPSSWPSTYGAHGALASDWRWIYRWDSLGRLAGMETQAQAVAAGMPNTKLKFSYDDLGRRITKTVLHKNGTGAIERTVATKFIYDGWRLFAEEITDSAAAQTVLRQYTWGKDISGSLEETGGVGGLLAVHENGTTHVPIYDANGNIIALASATTGNTVARWSRGPFGELISEIGATSLCPFGFTTHYTDSETGLVYFGHRFYSPETGRWLSREPLGEMESFNLYAYCHNDPINNVDVLGLAEAEVNGQIADAKAALAAIYTALGALNENSSDASVDEIEGLYASYLGSIAGAQRELSSFQDDGWFMSYRGVDDDLSARINGLPLVVAGMTPIGGQVGTLMAGASSLSKAFSEQSSVLDATHTGLVITETTGNAVALATGVGGLGVATGKIIAIQGAKAGGIFLAKQAAITGGVMVAGFGLEQGMLAAGVAPEKAQMVMKGAELFVALRALKLARLTSAAPTSGADDLAVMGRRLQRLGYDQANTNRILQSIKNGEQVVIVGENMKRVSAVSRMLERAGGSSVTYSPRNFRSTLGNLSRLDLEANRSWIRYWGMDKRATVIDIGCQPIPRTSGPSPFYGIENRSLNRWGIYTPFGN